MHHFNRFSLDLLLPFLACSTLAAESASPDGSQWTRFRGPNGSGVSTATNVPSRWADGGYRWKVELPGVGHASPVIWGDRVFVLCAENASAKRILLCLNSADGSVAWQRAYESSTFPKNRDNSYASSTPAVARDRVFVYWSTPDELTLAAFDHNGGEAWRRNLGPFKSQHGSGTSPVVLDDLVVVNDDQDGPSSLQALDVKTGATRWRVTRRADRASYATPCVRQGGNGKSEFIFASSSHGLTGVEASSGTVTWELTNAFPFRVVSSPILAEGLVIGTCGEGGVGRRLVAVEPGSAAKAPRLAYEMKTSLPYVPTPLAKDGLLFLWCDNGLLACHRAATGQKLWQEKLHDSFYASPVWAEGRLYCISKTGVVYVIAAAEEYNLISSVSLGEASFAAPALAHGALFLRTQSHLFCVGAVQR